MSLRRIFALNLRYLYVMRHSLDRATDMLYWPVLDLFLLGLTGTYFATYAPDSPVVAVVLSGTIFWLLVVRGQYEISVSILEEIWTRNLINIFASPLSIWEWLMGTAIVSFIKGSIALVFAGFIAAFVFDINLFSFLGWFIVPVAILLLISGWIVGLFVTGIMLRLGSKFQALAWSTIWVFSPFAALYYPVSVLPDWAEIVSKLIPMSYALEASRSLIFSGALDTRMLWVGFGIAAVYFVLTLWFFYRSFQKSLEKGLTKLY